jgi:thiopeptide-type bacteriocin biosynthesis protein
MPADRLTFPSPDVVATAVRAVSAGGDLRDAAARAGIDIADLEDAIGAYHAAGTAALEQSACSRWQHVSITFTDRQSPERTGPDVIGPLLDGLQADGTLACWWFLRKPPGWRVRMLDASLPAVGTALARLTERGVIASWRPGLYEPEAHAFGGPAGTGIAHELFCGDSRGVLDYLRRGEPTHGRRELSLLLISAMLSSAGLDWSERGDVFARVAAMRPAPPAAPPGQAGLLASQVRTLLGAPRQARAVTFRPGSPEGFAGWHAAFAEAGLQFGDASQQGRLTRGLRAVLAQALLFHWNRLAFTSTTQAILAGAAAQACLPGD